MPNKKELYQLTKQMLFAKFDGLCAFCGFDLGARWHIWEIQPGKTVVTIKGDIILGNDSYENKLPACISCNTTRIHGSHDKAVKISIEQFRRTLYREFHFMANDSMTATYYKKAVKFGWLIETGNPIVFHFEKIKTS